MKTMSQKSSNHWKSLFIKVPIIGTYFLLAACSVPETSVRPPVAVENPAPVKQIPVLCLAAHDLVKQGLDHLDPKAVEAYRAAGFDLHFGFYEETTAEKLAGYPLVVGMMPMLYPGTRVLDDRFGPLLSDFIERGGGFLLLPGPSYYGVQDFPVHLNPWLEPWGARLLHEPPRDPQNQQVIHRVLGFRYLGTRNLLAHPVTEGVEQLWLPLDFSDHFMATHTMAVDTNWTVLVRGEATCSTRPFADQQARRATSGTYTSAPPFLAVRDAGEGRVGLFSTSSQYFLFDAYHPAFADGFVMNEGGLRLMTQLMTYLAARASPVDRPAVAAATESSGDEKAIPIMDDKDTWLEYAQDRLMPAGFGVAGYVDCGSLPDLPFTPERGFGFAVSDTWHIRWTWSEIFHPTAANTRAFDRRPLAYVFAGLDPARSYRVGMLLWAGQVEGARAIRVRAGEAVLVEALEPPLAADGHGPRWVELDLPSGVVSSEGTLNLIIDMAAGGQGSFASIGELWLFEQGLDRKLSAEELRAVYESPAEPRHELLQGTKRFSGVIGARSTLSGGQATVAELCEAARAAGLHFLAFTEDAHRLGNEGLAALQEACRAESSATFKAWPGVFFRARYAGEAERRPDAPYSWGAVEAYTFHPLQRLPEPGDYDNAYNLMWKFFGGELSGGRPAVPTFMRPVSGDIPPWFTRFWRGLDVVTLDGEGRVVEDARRLYADLAASGYGPQPRVRADIDSVASLNAVIASGWRTHLHAPFLDEAVPYHYTSSIGNGPVIETFSVSFDHARDAGVGEGILFLDQVWLEAHVKIESEQTIRRVTLYGDTVPLRVWYPGATQFAVQESLLAARNHALWLRVEADNGREAISGRISLQDNRFMMSMCADNQNSICNLTRPATRYTRDDRELFLAHSYWHTGEAYGQIGAMRDARDLVPRVIETGIIQPVKYFIPTPVLHFADGSREDHLFSEMRITAASRDFNTVTYTFDPPGAKARSVVTLTAFRPAFEGDTVVWVESVLTANEDLNLRGKGRGIEHLCLAMLPDLAANRRYSWIEGGEVRSGAYVYDAVMSAVTGRLDAVLGAAMLWPSEVGSLLVVPLDGQGYEATFERLAKGNAREAVTISSAPGFMARGTTITNRMVVALHQGEVSAGDDLTSLRDRFMRVGSHVVSVTRGQLTDRSYPLRMDAEDDVVAITVNTADRHDPLPLVVSGLRDHHSALVVVNGRLQVAETRAGQLHFTLPPGLVDAEIVAGHPLRADHAEVVISWGGRIGEDVRFHAHNPTARPLNVRIKSNPAFPVAALDAGWTLAPGESVWLRGRGDAVHREGGTTVR